MDVHSETDIVWDTEEWFDWSGATDGLNDTGGHGRYSDSLKLPITPTSINEDDPSTSATETRAVTALVSPPYSSVSPESGSSCDLGRCPDVGEIQAAPEAHTGPTSSTDSNAFTNPQQSGPRRYRRHRAVEKRYRANLNDKMTELRDSVPRLQSNGDRDNEEADALTPSQKLNKGYILGKAVEYIHRLELQSKRLEQENASLKERLEGFNRILAQEPYHAKRDQALTSDAVIEEGTTCLDKEVASSPVQGLIPVPECWRRLRQNQPQDHYGHIYDKRYISSEKRIKP